MGRDFQHQHLGRLGRLWLDAPIYFITTNVAKRRRVLANADAFAVLQEVWQNAERLYGWHVGSYVVMPDHVHFFCAADFNGRPLSLFVGKWKEWTAKYLCRRHGHPAELWQQGFFDHVLRSDESYDEKWLYVQQNPVCAELVATFEEWPYRGKNYTL